MDNKAITVQNIFFSLDTVNDSEYKKNYTVFEDSYLSYTFFCPPSGIKKLIEITFFLEPNAQLRVELLSAYTNAQIYINCILAGQGSNATVHAAYLLHKNNKVSVSTMQHHQAPYTTSSLVMHGMVDDHASFFCDGMIRVEKEARCSISSQQNKNILLGDSAHAISIPSLEVLTDDVHCFHGSAMSRFDQESLFYGACRGLNQASMRRLLVVAFFAKMFQNKELIGLLEDVYE